MNPRPSNRHNGGYNAAYADGHVKWNLLGSTKPDNWAVNYQPGGGC